MKHRVLGWTARNPRTIIMLALIVLMLTVGATGEVAAHNPGGQEVPVCGHDHPGHNHHLPGRVC